MDVGLAETMTLTIGTGDALIEIVTLIVMAQGVITGTGTRTAMEPGVAGFERDY